jgi:transcriptional regulator with XRE-family HTH domain
MTPIVDQLLRVRQSKGWSQHDLAKACGLSRSTIARLEGGHEMKFGTVEAVFRALGLELLFVPAPLVTEVQSFVASGGKIIGQPMGVSAPLSIVAISEREVALARLRPAGRTRRP